MDILIGHGRGYVPGESHDLGDFDIGLIPMDANFSPVRKVAYAVENTRVGQRTDYDRLDPRDLDQRQRASRRRARLRGQDHQGSHGAVHPVRRDPDGSCRADGRRRARATARAARPQRRGARALGPLRQLPASREHQDARRSGAAQRGRDAQVPQLRQAELEGDHGDPPGHGPAPRHGHRRASSGVRTPSRAGRGVADDSRSRIRSHREPVAQGKRT